MWRFTYAVADPWWRTRKTGGALGHSIKPSLLAPIQNRAAGTGLSTSQPIAALLFPPCPCDQAPHRNRPPQTRLSPTLSQLVASPPHAAALPTPRPVEVQLVAKPPQAASLPEPNPVVVQLVANPPHAAALPGPRPVVVQLFAWPPQAASFPAPSPVVVQLFARPPHAAALPAPNPVVVQPAARPPQAASLPGPRPVVVHDVASSPHCAVLPGPRPDVVQLLDPGIHDLCRKLDATGLLSSADSSLSGRSERTSRSSPSDLVTTGPVSAGRISSGSRAPYRWVTVFISANVAAI